MIGGGGVGAGEPLDQSHELAGIDVDDLGGDGVDDDRVAGARLRRVGRRRMVVARRSDRRLPDLVGVFADFERRRPGSLKLSPR